MSTDEKYKRTIGDRVWMVSILLVNIWLALAAWRYSSPSRQAFETELWQTGVAALFLTGTACFLYLKFKPRTDTARRRWNAAFSTGGRILATAWGVWVFWFYREDLLPWALLAGAVWALVWATKPIRRDW